jgi:hypothetical protein
MAWFVAVIIRNAMTAMPRSGQNLQQVLGTTFTFKLSRAIAPLSLITSEEWQPAALTVVCNPCVLMTFRENVPILNRDLRVRLPSPPPFDPQQVMLLGVSFCTCAYSSTGLIGRSCQSGARSPFSIQIQNRDGICGTARATAGRTPEANLEWISTG